MAGIKGGEPLKTPWECHGFGARRAAEDSALAPCSDLPPGRAGRVEKELVQAKVDGIAGSDPGTRGGGLTDDFALAGQRQGDAGGLQGGEGIAEATTGEIR